ncbi:MAG: hypothetical protein Q8R01_17225 [Ramlibacter sp.]|nr:hypothetical protein [Ramlibacter sp.]
MSHIVSRMGATAVAAPGGAVSLGNAAQWGWHGIRIAVDPNLNQGETPWLKRARNWSS